MRTSIGSEHRETSAVIALPKLHRLAISARVLLAGVPAELGGGSARSVSIAELEGSRLWQILSTSVIMLLILVPYIAFTELSAVLGEGRLRRLLFGNPDART